MSNASIKRIELHSGSNEQTDPSNSEKFSSLEEIEPLKETLLISTVKIFVELSTIFRIIINPFATKNVYIRPQNLDHRLLKHDYTLFYVAIIFELLIVLFYHSIDNTKHLNIYPCTIPKLIKIILICASETLSNFKLP